MRTSFVAIAAMLIGLSSFGWVAESGSAATGLEDIPPVICTRHLERPGPDLYEFDWPVDPGKWPLVDQENHLRFPVGAYNGGKRPAHFNSLGEWWEKSCFDFVHRPVHIDWTMSAQDIAAKYREVLLDPALSAPGGVMVHPAWITAHNGMEVFAEVIRLLHDHPALWGWDPADEPFGPESGRTYGHELKIIRSLDREHPCLLNLMTRSFHNGELEEILEYCAPERPDFISTDHYPIQSPGRAVASVREIGRWVEPVLAAAEKYGMAAYVIHGTFGPSDKVKIGAGRFPSLAELRNQRYQALIRGFKGFLSWNYDWWARGYFTDLPLHTEMFRLNKEIHALTGPIFSTLDLPTTMQYPVEGRPDDVMVRASVYRDSIYVFAANLAEHEPGEPKTLSQVRIVLEDLPETYLGRIAEEAEVLLEMVGTDEEGFSQSYYDLHGEWRKAPVTWDRQPDNFHEAWKEQSNAYITDDLGPYAVHLYRLKMQLPHRLRTDYRAEE